MPTLVVNLQDEPYDVYIGRRGKGQDGYFGNPYSASEIGRTTALSEYRRYFLNRVNTETEFRRRVLALKGKRLGCFCVPMPCHGDIIAAWVDAHDDSCD